MTVASFTHLKQTERAYIAGLIDGEGSLSPLRGYPRLALWMTHRPTIEWLAEILNTPLRTGPPAQPGRKQIWGIRVHGRDVQALLREVRAYMITKADQADAALLWYPAQNGPRPATHCKYGHEFTPDNTRRKANGTKTCRACQKRRDLERTEQRRLARATH